MPMGLYRRAVLRIPKRHRRKHALEDGGAVLRLEDWNGRAVGKRGEVMRVRERVRGLVGAIERNAVRSRHDRDIDVKARWDVGDG
jgi:hypothetical protein